ncbi:glutathione S-transferase 1-1-like [Dermacentor variabilis]|uniref:glutathione S-transferase 1-1-like n=1 Tax=Dermacentor variabilis TaxID=34621 RepID=UPI003F5BBDEE
MTITLYNIIGSPPCNFVRTLAKHLDIDVKLKNLDYINKEQFSEEYLKINPFHKVPAIDDDGFIVYESNAIAYYLLRKYAPDSELYPACIKTRTHIDQILSSLVTTIHSESGVFIGPRVYQKTKPTTQEITAFEQNVLRGLEHLIGEGKFAVGDTFTLADMALTARIIVPLENKFVDHSKFPKLTSYYDRVKREQPHFEEIYGPAINSFKQMFDNLK